MRPYVVWAPPFDPNSGGIRLLHWFVHELNRTGRPAFVSWIPGKIVPDPTLNEPVAPQPRGDFIAVYPDTQRGNPLGAGTIARWAMNVPGRLPMVGHRYGNPIQFPPGTDPQWRPSDLIFPFARVFNVWNLPEERILYIPIRELDDYGDWGAKRKGRLVFVGKGVETPRVPQTEGLPELDKATTHDRKRLARTLNRCELLYTYDTTTGLTDIARLCGCPVVMIPNSHSSREDVYGAETGADGVGWGIEETEKAIETVDAMAMRACCEQLMQDFYVKLDHFVELTQSTAPVW